jgi:chaperonin GroEL
MEYNQPSLIVKNLNFGNDAKSKIMSGVDKLAKAVKSTLGASGKCVIYEDALGKPVITKDGVTVAESVVLYDPVENIGATLIKEAAKNTVKETGDGTTTAIVIAHALLKEIGEPKYSKESIRNIKNGIESGYKKVIKHLSKHTVPVSGDQLVNVSSIACDNNKELGGIIADAYTKVGKDGVVLFENSPNEKTYADVVDGVQINSPLISNYLITDKNREICELENPYVLIAHSPIRNIRNIQNILEYVIKKNRSLLIVGGVEESPKSALLANKVKGNIKLNIIDAPGFGPTKEDTIEDLAIVTGAKAFNESLGDDLELLDETCLGEVIKSITNSKNTVLTVRKNQEVLKDRIEHVKQLIKKEDKNPYIKKKLQERIAILSGNVGIVFVGANSDVELKEKKDRVEDAIYATKAALQEGIVLGGGVALLNAATDMNKENAGEEILAKAISAPFKVILENAGIDFRLPGKIGFGINVITGETVDMFKSGIIDPVLVTKSALKNAISVAKTIMSADCIISNRRIEDASN